jgi:hypothetical protein
MGPSAVPTAEAQEDGLGDDAETLERLSAALDAVTGTPGDLPRPELLKWLIGAGAAGTLAGGFWWRQQASSDQRPADPVERIELSVAAHGRGVAVYVREVIVSVLVRMRQAKRR